MSKESKTSVLILTGVNSRRYGGGGASSSAGISQPCCCPSMFIDAMIQQNQVGLRRI